MDRESSQQGVNSVSNPPNRNDTQQSTPVIARPDTQQSTPVVDTISMEIQSHPEILEAESPREAEEPLVTLSRDRKYCEEGEETVKAPDMNRGNVSEFSSKRDVMQFFHEQEKSLHERFLLLPQKASTTSRPQIPKCQQATGLEHLESLLRLMEQLTCLKDENSRLRQRCDYLESTKSLLQAKRMLASRDGKARLSFITPPSSRKHRVNHGQHKKASLVIDQVSLHQQIRPRVNNSVETQSLEQAIFSSGLGLNKTTSSTNTRRVSSKSSDKSSKRSSKQGDTETNSRIKGHNKRSLTKQRLNSSKWKRVKKVLTGHKIYEDLGITIRTIREKGRAAHGASSTICATSGGISLTSSVNESTLNNSQRLDTATSALVEGIQQTDQEDDPDLTSDIWMGPPDWWEEYEARREGRGGESNKDEDSSVIEVTTMYLGSNKDTTTSIIQLPVHKDTSTTQLPVNKDTSTTQLPVNKDKSTTQLPVNKDTSTTQLPMNKDTAPTNQLPVNKDTTTIEVSVKDQTASTILQEKCLNAQETSACAQLPEIVCKGDGPKDLPSEVVSTRQHFASVNNKGGDVPHMSDHVHSDVRPGKKFQKSAWSRVKDIIHTRKDSFKRKLKRDTPDPDNEETQGTDMQASLEDHFRVDVFSECLLSRPSPWVSPTIMRQQESSETSNKTVANLHHSSTSTTVGNGHSRGVSDLATLLGGNISEEFSKKMREWEEMRNQKPCLSDRDDSNFGSLDLSKIPRDLPVRTIDLRDFKGNVPDGASDVVTTAESNTSMEVHGAPSVSIDETPRHREATFAPKLQIDKELVTLEKEAATTIRERIGNLDSEEKLEILNGRVDKLGRDVTRQNDRQPLTGRQSDTQCQKVQTRQSRDDDSIVPVGERVRKHQKRESTKNTSPGDTHSEASLGEDETYTTTSQPCLTTSNIATLERANSQLLENLHNKEIDYVTVQEEVQKVNEKLAKVREDHASEMARFHSDLAKGKFAGPVKLEVRELEATVGHLEEKIKMMENFGEKLASSMESAAVGKWQSIEAEETIHKQLLELIEQMRDMLVQASQTGERSRKITALSNFETLYAHAMKLQVQMNNLRLSHLERNREIMVIKRQLLLQEVNNLLLQADITRRETELYQFQEAKMFPAVKRWNTFGGTDRNRSQVQVELCSPDPAPACLKARPQKDVRNRQSEVPRINIPYVPEEMIQASGISVSNPALPSTKDGSGVKPRAAAEHAYLQNGGTGDKSKDNAPPATEPSLLMNLSNGSYFTPQQGQGFSTFDNSNKGALSLQFVNRVQPRKYPPEQSVRTTNETSTISSKSSMCISQQYCPRESPQLTTDNSSKIQQPLAVVANVCSVSGKSGRCVSFLHPEIKPLFDSIPLHKEMMELRREKRKVEKEVSTFKITDSRECGPGCQPVDISNSQINDHSVPREKLTDNTPYSDEYSPECFPGTQPKNAHTVERAEIPAGSQFNDLSTRLSLFDRSEEHQQSAASRNLKCPIGHISNTSNLRQHKEESKDICNDCGPHLPNRNQRSSTGKPPLPRHRSPARTSASTSHIVQKEIRSKSVGDIDFGYSESKYQTCQPLQEVIAKFEKKASVGEGQDQSFSMRKIPSPSLHLPRVGIVCRMRRLQPATELLEESQRYRSGQSTYANRILKRYIPEGNHFTNSEKNCLSKENMSSPPAQGQSLDKPSAPSAKTSLSNSVISLKATSSSQERAEFFTHIVRKLSCPGRPEQNNADIDLMKNKRQLYALSAMTGGLTDSELPESNCMGYCSGDLHDYSTSHVRTRYAPPKPCLPEFKTSSSPMPLHDENSKTQNTAKRQSIHKSLPSLGSANVCRQISDIGAFKVEIGNSFVKSKNIKSKSASSSPSLRTCSKSKRSPKTYCHETADFETHISSHFQDSSKRKHKPGECIRMLCQHSIIFDLGLSGYSQHSRLEDMQFQSDSRGPGIWNQHGINFSGEAGDVLGSRPAETPCLTLLRSNVTEDIRSIPLDSAGDTATSPKIKKKGKVQHILESNFMHKSKKLFKVSK